MRICEVLQSGCIWMNDQNQIFLQYPHIKRSLNGVSLSAVVNHIAFGYTHIPDFPSVQPDTSVREAPKVSPPPSKSISSSSYSGKKRQTSAAGVEWYGEEKVVESDDSISSVSSSSSSSSSSVTAATVAIVVRIQTAVAVAAG